MSEKILFVDDEPQLLQAVERQLRKRFDLVTAPSGARGIEILQESGPFAVVVSDMRMPEMDGVQFLTKVREHYPDTVRMMLTGYADQETAVEAVNRGQIFRFLTKPCPTPILTRALALALHQFKLITAERELLDKTLKGAVNVMAELLSLTNPTAFSSGYRVKPLVKQIANAMNLKHLWLYEISAMMSQLGCITLPGDILHKQHAGVELTHDELETFVRHPETGSRLIRQIPRLEKVADIIELQLKGFDELDTVDDEVAMGAQILRAVIDYDQLIQRNMSHGEALRTLRMCKGAYNPEIILLLKEITPAVERSTMCQVRFQDVIPGMVAEEDVTAKNGAMLIPRGQEITWSMIKSLSNFEKHIGIVEPILVSTISPGEQ
ncbi:MAG: HD domain-containing phosphohydrolase [Thermodesulfobacteriota bacterium]